MSTSYIFSEFQAVDKTELMKLMLEYLYEEMPIKFDGNEDMMDFIQRKLMDTTLRLCVECDVSERLLNEDSPEGGWMCDKCIEMWNCVECAEGEQLKKEDPTKGGWTCDKCYAHLQSYCI